MAVINEGSRRNAEFLISEGNGTRSREERVVRVPAGETYLAGLVLEESGGKQVAFAGGTLTGILYEHADNSDGEADADFKRTIINADAEVQGEMMDGNGQDEDDVFDGLALLGIKVRGSLANVAT